MFKKILELLNIKVDKNQKYLLWCTLITGLLGTYTASTISKAIITELPAQWIAFQALTSSISGFLVGVIWKGGLRRNAIKYFTILAIIESGCGFLLGMYLCFVSYNVWVFAIGSLFYSTFITTFVGKCVMAFKAKLWIEKDREIFDNNKSIVSGLVCIIGFGIALIALPSLKLSLFLWGLGCILDDIGWIIVYQKNKEKIREGEV